jgi:hypothetical protein
VTFRYNSVKDDRSDLILRQEHGLITRGLGMQHSKVTHGEVTAFRMTGVTLHGVYPQTRLTLAFNSRLVLQKQRPPRTLQ